jgi:hypothetical protein
MGPRRALGQSRRSRRRSEDRSGASASDASDGVGRSRAKKATRDRRGKQEGSGVLDG